MAAMRADRAIWRVRSVGLYPLVHLCNANTRPSPAFPVYIDMPTENRRRWKHVRFYFGTRFGDGDFVPIRLRFHNLTLEHIGKVEP